MKFSIVTPAYNTALHIAETIESVLAGRSFEIEYTLWTAAQLMERLK